MYEIELKARVNSPETVREKISALGVCKGAFEKIDSYWYPSQKKSGASAVRIREETIKNSNGENYRCLITRKIKEKRDSGIEVNSELEFTVSSADAFSELLLSLGFQKKFFKKKSGYAWTVSGINAELANVSGGADAARPEKKLGFFLELEIIAQDGKTETTAAAKTRLFSLLAACGISEDKIEPSYYNELLLNG